MRTSRPGDQSLAAQPSQHSHSACPPRPPPAILNLFHPKATGPLPRAFQPTPHHGLSPEPLTSPLRPLNPPNAGPKHATWARGLVGLLSKHAGPPICLLLRTTLIDHFPLSGPFQLLISRPTTPCPVSPSRKELDPTTWHRLRQAQGDALVGEDQ